MIPYSQVYVQRSRVRAHERPLETFASPVELFRIRLVGWSPEIKTIESISIDTLRRVSDRIRCVRGQP
jgi:hypothetical protein